MRLDRLNEMEKHINLLGNASLEELASYFNVSINTIRRDINELLTRGNIRKVYGGVVSCAYSSTPFISREQTNTSAKQIIGELAEKLIEDDSTVFIDSGTTACQVIPYLDGKSNITIISNSLKVMYEVSKYQNIKLLALGGYYNYATASFVGTSTVEGITKLNFDIVLLGATCVSLKNGLTINTFFEENIKRALVKQNKGRIVLMADSGKYGKSALFKFCEFDDVDTIISECMLPQEYMDRMAANGQKFLCPCHEPALK